ncbi:C40 family peptidase [Clostridium sp. BL-8]|uniref:C40 family peptidase n=1 Tax=Clostridium sp. BL-8 TaxID=349938 RepID=UPI00098C9769|nr:C40 family peptidase [Clostridium sp. BL-8]OOM79422.1 putative endopeptidase p60 precursor [Clostridium sp. BL-8]
MKKNYKIAVVATLLFFITSIINTLPALAEPKELSTEQAIQNIQECDNKIEYNMNKLTELKEQIIEKENDIKDNEKEVEAAQKKVDERDDKLAERLRGIQLNGGIEVTSMQYLDAVFSSGNILDALKKFSLVSQICDSDKKLISEAKESQKRLMDIQAGIEKEHEELQKNEEDVGKQIKELEDQKLNLLKYVHDNNGVLNYDMSITIPVTLSDDITGEARALIEEAEKNLKVPYLWGGDSPKGFDCSGLMQYVFKSQGINMPRMSQEQQSFAKTISINEIKPGDLVFNKPSESTHVGMYIGDGMYIQAPHTGDVVKISGLLNSNMKYAGRVLN